MDVDVRGKGIKVTDEIKDYIGKRLAKLDHFTTRPLEAKVMLKPEGSQVKVEITVSIASILARAEVKNQELFQAIDMATAKLEAQIKNNKHKLVRNLQVKNGISDLFIETPEAQEMINSAVKIKQYKLEIMSFDEAAMQMELLDHDFFVYKNEKMQTCVVYMRNDGELGLIETF